MTEAVTGQAVKECVVCKEMTSEFGIFRHEDGPVENPSSYKTICLKCAKSIALGLIESERRKIEIDGARRIFFISL